MMTRSWNRRINVLLSDERSNGGHYFCPILCNGSRRSGSKFLLNCSTHNECKVFFEATVEWFRSWTRQSVVLLSAARIRAAINFRRRENSAVREPRSRTSDSRGHTYIHTWYHQKSIKLIRYVGTRTRTHARARFALARRLGARDLHWFYHTSNKNKSENEKIEGFHIIFYFKRDCKFSVS